MNTPRGHLDHEELTKAVESGEIESVLVAFTDLYGRLMGKRFAARHFLEVGFDEGTHACDHLLTVDMEMEPVEGYRYANWERGYGDFHLVPDFTTLRVASWLDRAALVLCDLHEPATHELVSVAPRSVLRNQLDRLGQSGYHAKAASELEYFMFEDSYRDASKKGYRDLETAGWYVEDYHLLQGTREELFNGSVRRHLAASGIPVENSKGEWGCGQHEMNIRYAGVLDMADRHTIMKHAMKEIADGLATSITFMAKPFTDQAGSSCHIHLSLWEGDQNTFSNKGVAGLSNPSQTFRWFLGGWIAHTPEVMVLFAPTVNSYKRYQGGSWAPTRLAWSHDNRTAGFRIVGEEQDLRIECRIPGADVNPYLAYAAILASGLDGIVNQIEPPEPVNGNAYKAEDLVKIPETLGEATARFSSSEFVNIVFGEEVQNHYSHFFTSEKAAFDNSVTDWERLRYFERI